ncbi:GGDEF domain-containing protein, partial [Chitinimonas sp. PSY-7]|uniref:diguanylate cyclase domain-containing protein n=1 Tax=Chitinimonas sp. PSY-7 TaxID=3459088 RepID=UPI004040025A
LLQDMANLVEGELNTLNISTVDELTNISNQLGFLQLGNTTLSFCAAHAIAATLVFFDIDILKSINDVFGHAEGDRVLQEFAAMLKVSIRGSDLIGRLSGDKFIVLVMDSDRDNTEQFMDKVAERIRDRLQQPKWPYPVAFSYGTVEFKPAKHNHLDQIIAEGNALMYV